MPPPMSALITAKDSNDDLVEVVLFEKFNDLRGFGRRLFLPYDVSFYRLINQRVIKKSWIELDIIQLVLSGLILPLKLTLHLF